MRRIICFALITFAPLAAAGRSVDPSRGVDPAVDYPSLTLHGPWDDRNYALTAKDVRLLPPGDEKARDAIPAYYRIELQRDYDLPESGPVRYPLNALAYFFAYETGYLVDGAFYRAVERSATGWTLDTTTPVGEVVPGATDGGVSEALEGEVRVTSPSSAAESAVMIHPTDTDLVIAGSNGPGSGQKMHYSSDGGETWTETTLPLGSTCCDPTVAWSSDGTKAYAATLGGGQIWFYRSGDAGHTWDDLINEDGDPRRELSGPGFNDKEFLHVDTYPTSPHQDTVYLTWHSGNVMRVAHSTDSGHSWSTWVESSSSDFLGVGSDVATDSAGNVYHAWPAFSSRKIWVSKSTDGGDSFAAPVEVATTHASFGFPLPAMETREVHTVVNIDVDLTGGPHADTIYVSWTDSTAPTTGNPNTNHGRIQVASSTDGGATWTVRTPHETADADTVDRFHPWLKVAPDGRAHIIYYDTRQDAGRELVDIYRSVSADGGDTWSTPDRITTASSPDPSDGFEFGDYNGLDIVGDRLVGIFTDNRNEGGGGGDSIDVYAAGETLDTSIFADGFESGDTAAWSTTGGG